MTLRDMEEMLAGFNSVKVWAQLTQDVQDYVTVDKEVYLSALSETGAGRLDEIVVRIIEANNKKTAYIS